MREEEARYTVAPRSNWGVGGVEWVSKCIVDEPIPIHSRMGRSTKCRMYFSETWLGSADGVTLKTLAQSKAKLCPLGYLRYKVSTVYHQHHNEEKFSGHTVNHISLQKLETGRR